MPLDAALAELVDEAVPPDVRRMASICLKEVMERRPH
jgi:hypothetical protein